MSDIDDRLSRLSNISEELRQFYLELDRSSAIKDHWAELQRNHAIEECYKAKESLGWVYRYLECIREYPT